MSQIIIKDDNLSKIDESKANQIKAVFLPMSDMLKKFEDSYNSIIEESKNEITEELVSKASLLRKNIAKVRIETEKLRKKQKQEYLLGGRAVDGVANILKWAVSEKEDNLSEIENYFERIEETRLLTLQLQREDELRPYIDRDPSEINLKTMPDDVWDAYLKAKKNDHKERIQAEENAKREREEKERKEREEKERKEIEDRKERERLEEENRILRQKAEDSKKKEFLFAQRLGMLDECIVVDDYISRNGHKVCLISDITNMSDEDFAALSTKHNKTVALEKQKIEDKKAADRKILSERSKQLLNTKWEGIGYDAKLIYELVVLITARELVEMKEADFKVFLENHLNLVRENELERENILKKGYLRHSEIGDDMIEVVDNKVYVKDEYHCTIFELGKMSESDFKAFKKTISFKIRRSDIQKITIILNSLEEAYKVKFRSKKCKSFESELKGILKNGIDLLNKNLE